MLRSLSLVAGLVLTLQALPAAGEEPPAEIFVDKGETFVRAGELQELAKGEEVTIVGPAGSDGAREVVGTAIVLEVWPSMARLSLDKAARSFGGSVFVQLANPASAEVVPLAGHATIVGVGPFKQVRVTNESGVKWTDCDVRLPNNKRFKLMKLAPGETEGIALHRFSQDGVERDVPVSSLTLSCRQGSGEFSFRL